jgi:hypothetical protein
MAGWVPGVVHCAPVPNHPVSRDDEAQPTPMPIQAHGSEVFLSGFREFNSNSRMVFAVMRMKVRRNVVVEIHANYNPKEAADFWH